MRNNETGPEESGRGAAYLIEYAVWPAVMLAAVGLTLVLKSVGINLIPATGVAVIAARLLVAGLEQLLPIHPDTRFYRDRSTWHDLVFTLYRETLGRWSGLAAIALIIGAIHIRAPHWPSQLPVLVQVVLLYLLYSFLEYWEHRAEHEIPLLWRFHAIHHAPSQMHHFKMDRHHCVSVLATWLVIFMPLFWLRPPLAMMIWLGLYEQVSSALKHSNIRQRFPLPLQYVLATSTLHHIHHSTDVALGNTNYANMAVWDVIFGTFTPPSARVGAYGVSGCEVPQSFFGSFRFPFRSAHRVVNSPEFPST